MEPPISRPVPPSRLRNSRSRRSSHGSDGSHPTRPTSRHSNPPLPTSTATPTGDAPSVPFPVPDLPSADSSARVTRTALKRRLRELLVAKDEEVKSTGRLGERLVSQRATLSEQIDEVERSIDACASSPLAEAKRGQSAPPNFDDEESAVGGELVEQVAALEEDLIRQRKDNDNVYRLATAQSEDDSAPETPQRDVNHRMSGVDPALATGISDSLLARIRGLQEDILKRDNVINSHTAEIEDKSTALRHMETTFQGLKEENWNLEVMCQELRTNFNETTTKLQKTEGERNHSARELGKAKETLEQSKSEGIALKSEIEKLRHSHETTLAAMRKQNAGLQRDRSDLQSALEGARTELDTEKRKPRSVGSRNLPDSNDAQSEDPHDAALYHAEEDDDATRTPRRKTGDGISTPMSGDVFDLDTSFSSEEALDASTKTTVAPSQDAAHLRRTIAHLRQALVREREGRKRAERGASPSLPDEPASPITRALGSRGRGRGTARGRKGPFKVSSSRLAQSNYSISSDLSENDEDEDSVSERSMQVTDNLHDSFDDPEEPNDSRPFDENEALSMGIDSNLSRAPSLHAMYDRQMVDAATMTDSPPKLQLNEHAVQADAEVKPATSDASMETDISTLAEKKDASVGVNSLSHIRTSDAMVGTEPDSAHIAKNPTSDTEEMSNLDLSSTPVKKRSTVSMGIDTDDTRVDHRGSRRSRYSADANQSASSGESFTRVHEHQRNVSMASEFHEDDFTDAERGTEDGYFTDALESAVPDSPSAASSRVRTPTTPQKPQAFVRTIGTQAESEHLTMGDIPMSETVRPLPRATVESRTLGVQTEAEEESNLVPVPVAEAAPTKSATTVSTQTDESLLPAQLKPTTTGFTLHENNRRSVGTFGAENLSPNRASFENDSTIPLPSPVSSTIPGSEQNTDIPKLSHKKSALETLGIRPESQMSTNITVSARDSPAAQQRSISDQGPQSVPTDAPSTDSLPSRSVRPIPPAPPELLRRARGLSARSVPSSKTPSFLDKNSPTLPGTVVSGVNQGKRGRDSTPYDESMPPPSSTQPRYIQSAATLRSANQKNSSAGPGVGLPGRAAQESGGSRQRPPFAPTGIPPMPLSARSARDRSYSAGGVSVSSMATSQSSDAGAQLPQTTQDPFDNGSGPPQKSTHDTEKIQAVTATMVGSDVYKYTRKKVGKGMSEKRHKRFCWVHPYSRTIHWSHNHPTSRSSARSALIYSVKEVEDLNPYPRGLPRKSLLVKSDIRDIRFTAPTEEIHDIWVKSINYLLGKAREAGELAPSVPSEDTNSNGTIMRKTANRLKLQRSTISNPSSPERRISLWQASMIPNVGSREGSIRQTYAGSVRSSGMATPGPELPDTTDEFGSPGGRSHFYANSELTRSGSISSSENIPLDDDDQDADAGFEGLENVRACCDGKHSLHELSASARKHHLKYHVNKRDPPPKSPDFRSRKGSRSTTTSSKLRQDIF